MDWSEIIVFIVYLCFMLGIGIFFFVKTKKNGSEKTYFLGGRQMGPWVTALSAGASDMSAWVLMGLPTSIYATGLGNIWIPVGLILGYAISWIVEAPRLRRFSRRTPCSARNPCTCAICLRAGIRCAGLPRPSSSRPADRGFCGCIPRGNGRAP